MGEMQQSDVAFQRGFFGGWRFQSSLLHACLTTTMKVVFAYTHLDLDELPGGFYGFFPCKQHVSGKLTPSAGRDVQMFSI